MGYTLDYTSILHGQYFNFLVTGITYTAILFVCSWIGAMSIALVLTVLRASGFPPLVWMVATFVAYHRNVPLLVQMLLWYFGAASVLPHSVNDFMNEHNAEIQFAIISLSLYASAYMSEDLRSGLRAVPRTQMEAARSIGFSYLQTMRWIIVPQTWRIALPPLVNQTLLLFKGTSIAAAISVGELTYQARQIESQSFRVFEAFSVVTALYLAGSFVLMFLGVQVARKYRLRT